MAPPGILAAHVLAALVFSGAWKATLVFYAASSAAVLVQNHLGARLQRLSRALAAVGLTALFVVFRENASLVSTLGGLAPQWLPVRLFAHEFAFVGLGYCYLRSLYALFDRRRWSLASYTRYYFFFPTFVSGPIMTPEQASVPASGGGHIPAGLARVFRGLLRIAGATLLLPLIPLGSRYSFDAALAWPVVLLWIGLFLSGLWLYLNFAGYTDVFVGLARACGVRAPENFDRPFAATDLTEFWQRWHMSLGAWLRAMVYTPLTRAALERAPRAVGPLNVLALLATMTVCGAWHGFTSSFLLWGLLHGFGLSAHGLWSRFAVKTLPAAWRDNVAYSFASWLVTHAVVAASWILFLPTEPLPLARRLALAAALFRLGPSG